MDEDSKLLPLAAFDYDGTVISGQSGKLIAFWLLRSGYLTTGVAIRLALWGIRYKLHLPYRQDEARELIFRDLKAMDSDSVRRLMADFHHDVLKARVRPQAVRELGRRKAEGCICLLVSATFEPIASEVCHYLGFDGYVATEMEMDETGFFTGDVEGDVVAGQGKVSAVLEWADEHLGQGSWRLAYAYGDHHTDKEMLLMSEHPHAVSPGPTLRRYARRRGWPIVDWEDQ